MAGKKIAICPDRIECLYILKRVGAELAGPLAEFDKRKIEINDTIWLDAEVDKEAWPSDLSKVKWYGPFSEKADVYLFQTATSSGKFYGFNLEIHLDSSKKIMLKFVRLDNKECSKLYGFGVKPECLLI